MIRNLFDNPLHILIVVLVIVVVVGWKRLPDVARSLGRSMRILKSEVEEMKQDGKSRPSAASSDTVKGETVNDPTRNDPTRNDPTGKDTAGNDATRNDQRVPDEATRPSAKPTASQFTDPTADPVQRETHHQPPA
jgi:sec-independent protein translocase protein TatA